MAEPPEPSQEIVDWLDTLRLPQYTLCFQQGGYQTLQDCKDLTDERLLELRVFPTGHRRRILRSLEALVLEQESGEEQAEAGNENVRGRRKPVPHPRHIFLKDRKRGTSSGLGVETEAVSENRGLSPPQPAPRNPQNICTRSTASISTTSSDSLSLSSHSEIPSDWEISSEDPSFSSADSVPYPPEGFHPAPTEDQSGFQGEMVENAIYEREPSIEAPRGPRPTRSYRLRHRPVPEIPNQVILPPQDSCNTRVSSYRKKAKHKGREPKKNTSAAPDPYEEDYSTVEECAAIVQRANWDMLKAATNVLPVTSDISPYACFYGPPKQQLIKAGWLDKLSPQGNCVFQRRWVRFDGESLAYYNNDKEMYSKGMILASAIRQVRGLGDNKFEVVTGLRTFIFRAEKEGERQEWMETLQTAARPPARSSQKPSDSFPLPTSTNKRGLLELRGYKGRVLVSLAGSKVRLCKTEQDYKAGLAIAEVELTAARVKDVDRRAFEINTPFKNFCFTAESEREKEEWIEAVQESIVETLSDYEVAEKIWFNEANRSCADCCAPQPEWASVNLGVVICKKCAGQHRSLGPNISKVRSLKLDSSIWSNQLVELFLEVGNKNANSFWAANLPLEEELYRAASAEQRATFIRRKYRERKYCKVLEGFHDQEQLNQALCSAVVSPDVLQTMALVFSGADVMCATGDPDFSTPYLLAQRAGQRLQMEFLHHNKLSGRQQRCGGCLCMCHQSRLFIDAYVLQTPAAEPHLTHHKHMVRRWCTLEGGFLSYYESERSPTAIGRVDITEVVSMAVSNTETMTGAGAVFTLELYLQTERVLMVGAETQETQHDWLQALAKCFVPSKVEGMVQRDSELIGRLHYKEGHDLYHWRIGWFTLEGSALHFSSGEGDGVEEVLQLKQLQELTVSTHTEGDDKIQVLLMVEGGRTVYIHGFNKVDFALWHSAISLAAGTDGRALGNQQLSKNGVPIVLDSCIAFVTQYGLCQEGVYQRPGDPDRVALLLEEFNRDARNVKLREKEHQLEDVTDTLKNFLSHAEDALLTKELYPYWVSALDEKDERRRVEKYSTFIQSLPKINRSTLKALLQHLYRIQQCSHLNQMPSQRLAAVFSSCLFQTQGQTPQEISVIQDLINNYVTLFKVSKKLFLLSPSMRPTELAESALSMRNIAVNTDDLWTTFEVIENGELERPLHHRENILEQVLEWSTLDDPRSPFLVIKKFAGAKAVADSQGIYLKFRDGSSKLLSGHKFQDKYVVLRAEKLLLYRDIKVSTLLFGRIKKRYSCSGLPKNTACTSERASRPAFPGGPFFPAHLSG
uniref:ArfGAP with RhoGAP domain, ankyrin repeat and PH domain 2 n=1 Tax=Myripristis murdjan TaxID=586833 RepID=A0A667Z8N0_9TELE